MRLFKDYSEEFEALQIEIGALKSKITNDSYRDLLKIQSLEDEIRQLTAQNSMLTRELIEIKQILLKQEPTGLVSEEIEVADVKEYFFNGLPFSKTVRREFKYTEIDDTFKFKNKRNGRTYHSGFTVFDVLLLKGLENEKSWESWSDLSRMTGMRLQQLQRLAYNISRGFFDTFDYSNLLTFSKEYGLLYVNGKKTNVPIKTVKYIIDCMLNSNKPISTLFKLEKSEECSQLIYRIIGSNYKNPELTGLISKNKEVPVENNPQKRKENGLCI